MTNKELLKRDYLEKIALLAGAGTGAASASAIASSMAAASSTGLLSSAAGSLGFVAAASNPVGWMIGGAALGAATLYGGSKIIGAKGYSDGDVKAHKQFMTDQEQHQYMLLSSKLALKNTEIAKKLLSQLPTEYATFATDTATNLDKGAVDAVEVIELCCEALNIDKNIYLNEKDFSLNEIEITIKIAILMALVDGEISSDEYDLIHEHIIKYFDLSEFDESDIELIFKEALGSDEQRKELFKMSFEETQNLFVVFFFMIQNDELKKMLYNFLFEIANTDRELNENETKLYNVYKGLYNSEKHLELYLEPIEKLNKSENRDIFSYNNKQKEYLKKLNNALQSYAKNILNEMVLSLHDATRFGKADNGSIITSLAIITDQTNSLNIIPFHDIYNLNYNKKDNILIIHGTPNEYNIRPFIAEYFIKNESLLTFMQEIAQINQSLYKDDENTINEKSYNIEDKGDNLVTSLQNESQALADNISSKIGSIFTTKNELNNIAKWHLAHNGTVLGVYSLQEIDEQLKNKQLDSDNLLVWTEGMPEWKLAIDVEETASIIQRYKIATPPPLPPNIKAK